MVLFDKVLLTFQNREKFLGDMMEHKEFRVKVEFKMDDNLPDHHFIAYASTFHNTDEVGDAVQPGAFDNTLKNRRPKLLWMHDMRQPVGFIDSIYPDAKGLRIEGRMPKEDSFVSGRLAPQLRIGGVDSMSIGYRTVKSERVGEVNKLLELDLFEVSFVTIPANTQATLQGFKGATHFDDLPIASRERHWDSAEAIKRVREYTGSTDAPTGAYKKAFLWYDSDAVDSFGSYKLPFADVIDGEMMAVPRAIFAAAASMRGARGGVGIPEEDRDEVVSHIESYYKEMDMISPFKSLNVALEFAGDFKGVEFALREHLDVSRKNAKMIISEIKRVASMPPKAISQCDAEKQTSTPDIKSIFEKAIKGNQNGHHETTSVTG